MLAQIKPNAGRPKVIAMGKYLRDPAPEMRAAAAAGVVRAGGAANLDDLYVLFKDNDARPALAALRELERVPSEKATELIARLARRPQREVQKAAAEMLIRRNARDHFSALKPYLEPKADPELRALALASLDEAAAAERGRRHEPGARRLPRPTGARRARTGDRLVPRARRGAAAEPAGGGDGRLDRDAPADAPRTSPPPRRPPADPPTGAAVAAAQGMRYGVTLVIGTAVFSPRILPFDAISFRYQSNESFGTRFWFW